jgi:hypothetical protein
MGAIPLGIPTILALSLVFSLLFIGALSLSFVGSREPYPFKALLNEIAEQESGVRCGFYIDMVRS